MDLVRYINNKCPIGISHSHELGERPQNNKSSCVLCTNKPKGFWICINHKVVTIEKPSIKSLLTLKYCMTYSEKYYLPKELHDIVFKFCVYKKVTYPILELDKIGIDHMLSCRLCSSTFVNWYENEACNRHMLPRKNSHNRNRDIKI